MFYYHKLLKKYYHNYNHDLWFWIKEIKSITLKQRSLFASCSFIESVDIANALMEGAFPNMGMPDPLERVLTDEDLD